ncbi:GGDEF domain-containing protein [Phreatobacter stygius]|nr:GGDEF domain-containing protein [Phreatobacter stygius]
MTVDVPTLYVVILANCLAIGLVWLFVIRAHPKLAAGRIWMAGAFIASAGAGASMLRGETAGLGSILVGNGLLILASCMSWVGTRQFLGEKRPWLATAAITLASLAALALFTVWQDDMAARIVIYSAGQCIPLGFAMADLLSRREGRRTPGMMLAASAMGFVLVGDIARAALAVTGIGGPLSFLTFNGIQSAFLLTTLFGAMVWNFGFLLMTIDRLRSEIIHLAVLDDLTGVANRRRFIQRLDEECSRSNRTGHPFVLLAIDLDGFKGINDRFGHQAGDACLRQFTDGALLRLRGHDLLARTGGDEFCVILPATTLEAAEAVARALVESSREQWLDWEGEALRITVSVGLAEWSKRVGRDTRLLLSLADEALYEAKRAGRDTFVAARRDRLFKMLGAKRDRAAATGS